MVSELIYILGAVVLVSIVSLVGILSIYFKKNFVNKYMFVLVAFATGTLLGTVFLDLIPESIEIGGNFGFILLGLILFFGIESFVHWHHHEIEDCKKCLHPVAHLTILGDSFHNFLDGVIIAASFLVSIPTGMVVTFAIIMHEVPQEIGDFLILIHSGLSRKKALMFNFLSATFSILGGLLAFFFLNQTQGLLPLVTSLAAGGLLYVAASDLIPELHKTRNYKKIVSQFLFLVLGVLVIWTTFFIFPR
jgi:zinc and cadmium transporter